MHAFGVARILRSPSVIYPLGAGVMSAVGFLVAPLSFDFVRTLPGPLDALDWKAVARAVAEMEAEGRAILGRTIPAERVRFRRFADMRYRKQGYEIRVPIPDGPLEASRRDEVRAALRDRVPRGLRPHGPRRAHRGRCRGASSPRGPGRSSGSRPAPARAGTRGPR